jgi:hypothetical protein
VTSENWTLFDVEKSDSSSFLCTLGLCGLSLHLEAAPLLLHCPTTREALISCSILPTGCCSIAKRREATAAQKERHLCLGRHMLEI